MLKITGYFIFLLFLSAKVSSAQNVLCFENKEFNRINRISFELEGSKLVEGYFETVRGSEDTSAEAFGFSGTKSGASLTIKFAGTIPFERAPKTRAIVWTLEKETLKVPVYEKNPQTNRLASRTAIFKKCTDN